MKTRIKTSLVPPNGWTYLQDIDGHKIVVESHDLMGLFDQVLKTRMENKIEVGDVVKEVEEQICARSAEQCHRSSDGSMMSQPVLTVSRKIVSKSEAVLQWAYRMESSSEDAKLVTPKEVHERARHCANCPAQEKWAFGCGPCVANARRLLAIIRRGKTPPYKDRLLGCKIHKMDTETAVFMNKPSSKSEKQPDFCWVE